ncbi:hypothetical protein BDW22DRAFT_1191647 [Trametopsis cervina]|nr:hypothetical protein BDW22DRAFT_1191647 [Trametopsis cervina]
MTSTSLFPVDSSRILTGFTTVPSLALPNIAHTPLSDAALGVHRVSPQTTHAVVASAGRPQAWEAVFPAGSINPGNKTAPSGGFGFYARGPPEFRAALEVLEEGQEVVLSYEVLFEDGWEWQKGGKLPGMYGGAGDSAYGCTGGRQTDRCKCFNLRLMWRENGAGELYTYLPPVASNTAALLSVPPRSLQHADYGFSVGRGAWVFVPGRWTAVAQRVRMNARGAEDGEIEVYIDGRSVLRATGLVIRGSEEDGARVQGIHLQTFFGGHTPEWAAPKEQRAWFASVSGAVLCAAGGDGVRHDEL